jgi:hypothetical protein
VVFHFETPVPIWHPRDSRFVPLRDSYSEECASSTSVHVLRVFRFIAAMLLSRGHISGGA